MSSEESFAAFHSCPHSSRGCIFHCCAYIYEILPMYQELCFVSANKTLQKYLVPMKLLDFPNLNKNAEFLSLKFTIDSADDRLCNCNHRKMYSSTILFEFRRDLGGISNENLH